MQTLLQKLSSVFFSDRCLLCELKSDTKKLICTACFETLPVYESLHNTILPIDHVHALFHYTTPISDLIWKLKFQGDLSIAKLFAHYWIDYLETYYKPSTLPDLLLPVPLHFTRLKQRGFNQALEIARPIGKYFDIPIDTRSCIKIKNTAPQSSLSAEKRKDNVKNAFGLSYSIHAKHIAIVDDVVTTGNTASEIAQLLKIAGVTKVDLWCCARA